jgi:hypothetical protein
VIGRRLFFGKVGSGCISTPRRGSDELVIDHSVSKPRYD